MAAPLLHVPVLRFGRVYRSLDVQVVADPRTGAPLFEVGMANAALITRDLGKAGDARAALRRIPARRRIAICEAAAARFLDGALLLGEGGEPVSPGEYVRLLSASTGLPHALLHRNMRKIHDALANMDAIVAGLTRHLDPDLIDAGEGEERGTPLSYAPLTDALGVALPSNSPGVNALWLPSLALGVPVALKPGRADPLTPHRIARALVESGLPPEAIAILPSDHAGADALLAACGRSLLFGDAKTTARYAGDARVEVHGPGWSKVILGADVVDDWPRCLDVMARSIADNGGRSCVNASAVVVPRHGRAIAEALAAHLASITPRAPDDPEAALAGFTDAAQARAIDAAIDAALASPGAEDLSARARGGPRLVERDGLAYLLPTIVHCGRTDHPLAQREFLFPFAAVIERPEADLPAALGPTLVATLITRSEALVARLRDSPRVDRLNVGAIPTPSVRWDQPHEGNLFDHLFRRRAFQRAPLDPAAGS